MDFRIGKPYSFRDYNCWHYARDIRAQAGIKTRNYNTGTLKDAFEVITSEMQNLGNGLKLVETPQNYDIIIGNKKKGTRYVYHCGIYYNGDVVHCDRTAKQVVMNTYREFTQGFEGFKLWR